MYFYILLLGLNITVSTCAVLELSRLHLLTSLFLASRWPCSGPGPGTSNLRASWIPLPLPHLAQPSSPCGCANTPCTLTYASFCTLCSLVWNAFPASAPGISGSPLRTLSRLPPSDILSGIQYVFPIPSPLQSSSALLTSNILGPPP